LFVLFFISGFCGLLYQVVWVRLAFASFGIITPVLSVVISVFMLGLALGSWGGGAVIGPLVQRTGLSAIVFYGAPEALIGVGAIAVPELFSLGEKMLLHSGEADSFTYLFLSALVIAISVLPWCAFMGTTFPLMMAFVRENDSDARSFSFLYLANVIGAMTGTLMTAGVLIEVFGFRRTLWIAGGLNALVAAVGGILGVYAVGRESAGPPHGKAVSPSQGIGSSEAYLPEITTASRGAHISPQAQGGSLPQSRFHFILFMTGFASLALEVVWTRAFTPVMGTQVYAFALLLFVYLLATWTG